MDRLETPLPTESIFRLIYDLKKAGKTIGFTHGAFDLFHVGHLRFLQEAKKECDILVVAIESDSNISSYKNVLRPIISEHDRLAIVSNVLDVSLSFINPLVCTDDNYEALYKEVQANTILYGDYFHVENYIEQRAAKLHLQAKKVATRIRSTTDIINAIVTKWYQQPGEKVIFQRVADPEELEAERV